MLIGEVARRSGIPAHTIRFYETQQLVSSPARATSGYRVYSDQVLSELGFIKQAQQLGFTLDDIKEILTLGRSGRMPCKRVAALCEMHLQRIDRQIDELKAFRKGLLAVEVLAQGGCGLTVDGFCRAIIGLEALEALSHDNGAGGTRRRELD